MLYVVALAGRTWGLVAPTGVHEGVSGNVQDDGLLIAGGVAEVVPAAVLSVPLPGAIDASKPARADGEWRGKRVVDVVLATVLLLVALPLFLLVALAIKLSSPGPVFFRQRRVGRDGVDFPMLKFRTMQVDSEERLRTDDDLRARFLQGSHKIPSRLDPRVTPLGRVLRRLSVDELPQ